MKITSLSYPECNIFLFNKGWQRITFYSKDLYANNNIKPPNQKQKKELIDLAITNNFERIIYDNENIDKVIWHVDYD